MPLAQEMNVGVIALRVILNLLADRIPLHAGAPAGPGKSEAREKLIEAQARGGFSFLDEYGVKTPGQALLKYVLSHPAVSTIITATGKVERIAENAAASDGRLLPPEARRRLEDLIA